MSESGDAGLQPGAAPADVRLEDVVKRFDDVRAVDGISLEIPHGSFFALLGPVGLRQDDDAADDRRLRGADLGQHLPRRPRRRRAAAVQARRQHRLPELRALPAHDDLRQRRVRARAARRARRTRSARACSRCSSSSTSPGGRMRKPRQLSGGQQQRVALARALVNNPRVLLLDEPLGALDLKLRKQMQLELKRIQHEVGITFVHVTHDQEEAMTMADTIAVMNQGRIEQLGSPTELYERPRTAFVAGFLGKSNLLEGVVESAGRGSARRRHARPCGHRAGDRAGRGRRATREGLARRRRREPPRRHRARERLHRRRHRDRRRDARRRHHRLPPERRDRGLRAGASGRTSPSPGLRRRRSSSTARTRRESHDRRPQPPAAASSAALPALTLLSLPGLLAACGGGGGGGGGSDEVKDVLKFSNWQLLHRLRREDEEAPDARRSSPRRPGSRSTTSRTSTRTPSTSGRSSARSRRASRSTATSSSSPTTSASSG